MTGTFRNFCKSGEIDPSLLGLISLSFALISLSFPWPFAFVPNGFARTLALILLSGLGAFSSEVGRTSTVETTVSFPHMWNKFCACNFPSCQVDVIGVLGVKHFTWSSLSFIGSCDGGIRESE